MNRFNRRQRAGLWDRLLKAVSRTYSGDAQMIASSDIRVRQHAINIQKRRSIQFRDPVSLIRGAA
jgi:hypothetical protein